MADRKLAVVTGASTVIGLELARRAAEDGCELVVVADEPAIETAAATLRQKGVEGLVPGSVLARIHRRGAEPQD